MKKKQFKGIIGHPTVGFGLIPDPVGHRYNAFFLHPASKVAAAALPKATNNVIYAPPVWNQAQTGSCFGHGMAGQITTTFAARGRALPSPACPRYIYDVTREIDRPDPSQKLTDEGSQPNSGVRALSLWGLALESEMDSGRTADSPDYSSHLEAHVNDDSKLGELEAAGKRIITGFNAIADDDPNKILQFQQALAAGCAVGIGVDAGSDAFQSFTGQGVLDYCGAEPDHWIFMVDYRTNAASKPEFLIQNSWGKGLWTPDGRAWVTQDFVQRGCFGSLVTNVA